jgi:hypothetical protein
VGLPGGPGLKGLVALLILGVVSVGEALSAPTPAPEPTAPASQRTRWHFVLDTPPVLRYSLLFTRSPSGDETLLLVEYGQDTFELDSRQDVSGQDSVESVRHVRSGERLQRRLLLSGYGAVSGCEDVRPPDACVLFEARHGKLSTSLLALSGSSGPRVRARLLALIDSSLQKSLLAFEQAFGRVLELDSYGEDFLGLVWPGRFSSHASALVPARREPGCDFDAAFGYPCAPAEKRREGARRWPGN